MGWTSHKPGAGRLCDRQKIYTSSFLTSELAFILPVGSQGMVSLLCPKTVTLIVSQYIAEAGVVDEVGQVSLLTAQWFPGLERCQHQEVRRTGQGFL